MRFYSRSLKLVTSFENHILEVETIACALCRLTQKSSVHRTKCRLMELSKDLFVNFNFENVLLGEILQIRVLETNAWWKYVHEFKK